MLSRPLFKFQIQIFLLVGAKGDLFTGALPNSYGPPAGFCFDILCSDPPIMVFNYILISFSYSFYYLFLKQQLFWVKVSYWVRILLNKMPAPTSNTGFSVLPDWQLFCWI